MPAVFSAPCLIYYSQLCKVNYYLSDLTEIASHLNTLPKSIHLVNGILRSKISV